MRSFMACHILTGNHVYKIGFDQISPSASPIRDLGARLIINFTLRYPIDLSVSFRKDE